ncbi:MAG: hypothetical protein AAFU80_19290 [Pseudomonadota bacterium]
MSRPGMLRGGAVLALVVAAALAVWLWGFDGIADVKRWAVEGQRRFQQAMAGGLRAIKRGDPGAVATLLGLCFAYGFFHAIGPGHGKVLIGGYGLGRRVPLGRLVSLAFASSLAQTASAVALVYAGVLVLGWTRQQMTGLADNALAPVSYAAIGVIGLWLVWRGVRGLGRALGTGGGAALGLGHGAVQAAGLAPAHGHAFAAAHAHGHGTAHTHGRSHEHGHRHGYEHGHAEGHGEVCGHCGHAHGPTPEQAAEVRSLRDALVLIAGIAVRPCTGALFVLILTWNMGIAWTGIAGAVAMGLGTASVTAAVALAAVTLRESTFTAVTGGRAVARVVSVLELAAGVLVAVVATQLLVAAL